MNQPIQFAIKGVVYSVLVYLRESTGQAFRKEYLAIEECHWHENHQ